MITGNNVRMLTIRECIKAINAGLLGIFNFRYTHLNSALLRYQDYLACQRRKELATAFLKQPAIKLKKNGRGQKRRTLRNGWKKTR